MKPPQYEVMMSGNLDIRPSMLALFGDAIIAKAVEFTLPDHYEQIEQILAEDDSFVMNLGDMKAMIPSMHSYNHTEFVYASYMVDIKGKVTYWETTAYSKDEFKSEVTDI